MKKLVLTLVLGVFAFGVNAQTIQASDEPSQDCLNEAWEFGTSAVNNTLYRRPGVTDEQIAFEAMEWYIESNC